MRLIDGDKLIDIITNSADLGGVWGQVLRAVKDAFIRLIRTMPNVNPEPQWIPWNSGKPPEESGTYAVTAYDGTTKRVTYAKYQKRLKRWELTGARAYWRVLAWMPLPEPWRGDEE